MFKVCLKKGYDEKEIIHIKKSEKNNKSEIMSKMGKMPNILKLKGNIVHSIKGRDIENSPHKLYDLSSSESCDGDGGATLGTRMEEEALEALLMKRRNHGSRPSSLPNTKYWLPLSELEALSYELVCPSLICK